MTSEGQDAKKCKRCAKPKDQWENPGLKAEDGEYCCEGCLKDTGCTCKNNQYDFDNRDTRKWRNP